MVQKVNLAQKFASFRDYYAPSNATLAIAGDCPFSVSYFRAKLYHATKSVCIAVW